MRVHLCRLYVNVCLSVYGLCIHAVFKPVVDLQVANGDFVRYTGVAMAVVAMVVVTAAAMSAAVTMLKNGAKFAIAVILIFGRLNRRTSSATAAFSIGLSVVAAVVLKRSKKLSNDDY